MKPIRILALIVLVAAMAWALRGWQAVSELRLENQKLHDDIREGARASSGFENELARRDAEIKRLRGESAEVLRLRNELAQLRKGSAEAARLRGENQQLRQMAQSARPAAAAPPTDVPPGDILAKENWAFAGYATPEAALQSAVFAMSQGDPKGFLAAVTPEERARMEKEWENKTEQEIGAEGKREMEKITSVQILERRPLSETEMVLVVYAAGEGHAEKMLLKKIGSDWKMAGHYREEAAPVEK
jgi:uncharacterized protein YhaN